jgi:2-C-methyl-D-erythritol 2,4-cyclodiphosphate synthase
MRIGFGYDIHRLVEGRPLILGGVSIPHAKGLEGHSDADVLVHAVADALLGAAALGDIGIHFPDTDPAYKDVSSLDLLGKVKEMLRKRRFRIINIDSTIVAELPKIAPFRAEIITRIAHILDMREDTISVKASTNEKMGPVGQSEAIQAFAVALISG